MARGTESKEAIFKKLQEVYKDAFWESEGKILRIPLTENGTRVEVKVTLTAAKANLGGDEVASAFGDAAVTPVNVPDTAAALEPSDEEKENINKLLQSLGM